MPAVLIAGASLKKFHMRFQWWPTLLLEWGSTLQTVAQLLREGNFLEYNFFANFHFFQLLFRRWFGKNLFTQKNNSPQLIQYLFVEKDLLLFSYNYYIIILFSYKLFVLRIF